MTTLHYNVFGHVVLIAKSDNGWVAYYAGVEGKRRPAIDIEIPPNIAEVAIEQWPGDFCHESASARCSEVMRLD